MEAIHHHGPLLTIPVGLMPSVMAIPSLATIPGSAAPTPSPHSSGEVPTLATLRDLPSKLASVSPPQTPPLPAQPQEPPDPYANLDSTGLEHFVTPPTSPAPVASPVESYFPATSANIPLASATPQEESDRQQPEIDIEIPDPTPSEPLFSSYPEQVDVERVPSDKGKGRAFVFPLRSLGIGRTRKEEREDSGRVSPELPKTPGRPRASTVGAPASVLISPDRRGSHDETSTSSRALAALYAITPSKSLKHFRRRSASVTSQPDLADAWNPRNSDSESSLQHPTFPLEPTQTPESDSTGKTAKPLASPTSPRPDSFTSPPISPRSSSLRHDIDQEVVYSLASMPPQPIDVIIATGDSPHPPPRSSSLEFSPTKVTSDDKTFETIVTVPMTDINSLLSSSLTTTETSGTTSADFHSASTSSKEHPLSSASTSLSRSAKSGKEGEAKDALSALRLQRSLEWEAKQTKGRRRLEKRRMVLFELVETEVGYTQDLKTLVHVYLPQLFSLPGLSETTTRAIARNAQDLLDLHEGFMSGMVMVLKEEELTESHDPDMASKLDRVARRLAGLFVAEVSKFSVYNEYCAGSITAAALVRRISLRPDFDMFERRCQVIAATLPHRSLEDLLRDDSSIPASPPTSPGGTLIPRNRSRLHFRDFLIMPIQRVCRYPLLLNQLLGAASSPMPDRDDTSISDGTGESYDVGVDVERALGAMKGVAEEADEARRLKDVEIKTATIIDRLEPHPALPHSFLQSLGNCRLIGSLDVLHHHPTLAPLVPPVKVKYLAAFLYKGYLILGKVKKGKTYEVKHYLPLEVFELIDITEGFLPHSVRLSLREHNFDLAASCEAEKEVWSAALNDARESSMPPFELPASVSPFAARKRRMSAVLPFVDHTEVSPESKRHTILGPVGSTSEFGLVDLTNADPTEEAKLYTTPPSSPTRSSFGFTPDQAGKPGQPSTILLRRATAPQRLVVDRGLGDIISESCATARSKAQLHQVLFLPDVPLSEIRDRMSIRDSTLVRRRRSILDSGSTFDIAFTGEIRGSVIPIRHQHRASYDTTHSHRVHGHARSHSHTAHSRRGSGSTAKGKLFALVPDSSTDREHRLDESADDAGESDLGTLTQGVTTAFVTRNNSSGSLYGVVPVSPLNTHHQSLSNLRQAALDFSESPARRGHWLDRRQTASAYNLNRRSTVPNRAKSMPVSPHLGPHKGYVGKDLPPLPPLKDLPTLPRGSPGGQMLPPPFLKRMMKSDTGHRSDSESNSHSSESHGTDSRDGSEKGETTWKTIRRSMSFRRERSDSRPAFSREPSEREVTVTESPRSVKLGLPLFPRPTISRQSSGVDGGGPASVSDEDGTGTTARESGEEEGEREGPGGLRRKKSTRLLQSLRGFTPI